MQVVLVEIDAEMQGVLVEIDAGGAGEDRCRWCWWR